MSDSFDNWIRGVMSGERRGATPSLLRGTLRAIEPAYAGVTSIRNRLFDAGTLGTRRLSRPVISVGNLTTGGTGKTPFVQWLVRELIALGAEPAVLMRGYGKREAGAESDEERVLRESLRCAIHAAPDRYAAGVQAIAANPAISAFVLDDGFQHRQLARDLDVVLIDVTNPFGFDHVLPRGMLREPRDGLGRAGLIVMTRCELSTPAALMEVERQIHALAPATPRVRAQHRLDEVKLDEKSRPLGSFASERVFAVSAIGNPAAFEAGLEASGIQLVGRRRFGDHHPYTQADVASIAAAAHTCNATIVFTTEKDWAKLRAFEWPGSMAVARVMLRTELGHAERATTLSLLRQTLSV